MFASGLLGYYRRHIAHFAQRVNPLYDLVKSPVHDSNSERATRQTSHGQLPSYTRIQWRLTHQEILEGLIHHIINPPLMAYPDFTKPFILHTDASELGLGAVFYERQGSQLKAIAYASRALTTAEKNYKLHAGKLEFLALTWATYDHFKDYLLYSPKFIVYTDNNPLTYVFTSAKLNATGLRWIGELSDFDFEIKYRTGKANVDADTMSRSPSHMEQYMPSCSEKVSLNDMQATIAGGKCDTKW